VYKTKRNRQSLNCVKNRVAGPPEYYFRLCKLVKSKYADFRPDGMADWEAEQSEDRIKDADNKLKDIVSDMRDYIFSVFRMQYGSEKDAYWEKGITDKTVKLAAYNRSLDTDLEDRLPPETYLEVLEMKKVVEAKAVWPMFKPVFNIPEPNEKGQAKNLKWMERVTSLTAGLVHILVNNIPILRLSKRP
jgi:DNA sulfur modification protein DndB